MDIERTEAELKRWEWRQKNKGALARIARETNLTLSFVAAIFRGIRRSYTGEIEKRLRDLGAPGFGGEE